MLHGGKPSAEKKDKSLRMDALQGRRARAIFDLCLFEHFSPVANFGQQSLGACVCSKTTKILVVLGLLYLLLRPTKKERVLGFLREKSSRKLVGKPRAFIQQADLLK